MKRNVFGFTLIEVVVVVAIIGIIASIAWHLYIGQTTKQRRADGVRGLMLANQEMTQCKTDNATYTGCVLTNAFSPDGQYSMSVAITGGGDEFTLTATRTPAVDDECTALTLDHLGRKGYTGTAPSLKRCWGD